MRGYKPRLPGAGLDASVVCDRLIANGTRGNNRRRTLTCAVTNRAYRGRDSMNVCSLRSPDRKRASMQQQEERPRAGSGDPALQIWGLDATTGEPFGDRGGQAPALR